MNTCSSEESSNNDKTTVVGEVDNNKNEKNGDNEVNVGNNEEEEDLNAGPTKCSNCSEEMKDDLLYFCKSCEPSTSSGETHLSTQGRYLCKICILPHSKQKHSIVDNKGSVPCACTKHSNIVRYYCRECKILLCYECLENFCNHELMPVHKMSIEVRGKVFEYMEQLDYLDKKVRHRSLLWKDVREKKKESDLKYNAEFIYNLVFRKIKEYCIEEVEKILSNSSIGESGSDLDKIVAEADELSIDLRNCLQLSTGSDIQEEEKLRPKVEKSLEDQRTELSKCVYLKPFNIGVSLILEDFKQCLDNVIRSIEPARIEVIEQFSSCVKRTGKSLKSSSLVCAHDNLFNGFCILRASKDGAVEINNLQYRQFNEKFGTPTTSDCIKFIDIASVYMSWDLLVFHLKDSTVEVFNFIMNQLSKVDSKMPPHPILRAFKLKGQVEYVYWDEKNAQIRFTDNDELMLKSEVRPKCCRFSYNEDVSAFVISNTIHIYFLETNNSYVIPREENPLTLIDDIQFLSQTQLLAYDAQKKLVAYFSQWKKDGHGTENKWVLQGVAKVDDDKDHLFIYDMKKTFNACDCEVERIADEHGCNTVACCGKGLFNWKVIKNKNKWCCYVGHDSIFDVVVLANKYVFICFPCEHIQ